MPSNKGTSPVFVIAAIMGGMLLCDSLYAYHERSKNTITREKIQKYLANPKNRRPLMWVHVPYELNSRQWDSFMSRNSQRLNQPYLEVCLQSIVNQCDDTFNICIVDDTSFQTLIPDWDIDMAHLASPSLERVRQLAMTKLLYLYGGVITPISFVCLRDMLPMYDAGTRDGRMFVCENVNRNVTASSCGIAFMAKCTFIGAEKKCPKVLELIELMQRVSSADYTSDEIFSGHFDRWCQAEVDAGRMNIVRGTGVGVKTVAHKEVTLHDLLVAQTVDLCPVAYGIWIPMEQLLVRAHYDWFLHMSKRDILESAFSLAHHMFRAITPAVEVPGGLDGGVADIDSRTPSALAVSLSNGGY